jgi:hypothetical protein
MALFQLVWARLLAASATTAVWFQLYLVSKKCIDKKKKHLPMW